MSAVLDKSDDPIFRLRIVNGDHTPSWLRRGEAEDGFAELTARAHKGAGWLSITLTEGATLTRSGRGTEKRTMVDLDEAEARTLRDLIDLAFPRESGK
jgi:hypothetical protein